jgi:hypothetical protein
MARRSGAFVIAMLMMAGTAAAADAEPAPTESSVADIAATALAPLAAGIDWSLPVAQVERSTRGPLLPALYVSLASLNAFDAYSTVAALERGAVEANPVMRGVAGNPAALWAVKGGVTALSIYAAERLWRNNRRVAAIAVMAVTNGLMTAVAARNSTVLSRQGR